MAWLDPRIAEIVASAACGGVVTLLLFRIAKKRGKFSYFVHHNRIAMSADDLVFGNVQVTWNQEPVANLFLSTVELKNDSLKDFEDVVVKVFTNDTTLLTRMLHNSLVRRLARPLNAGLFEPIGACAFSSHG